MSKKINNPTTEQLKEYAQLMENMAFYAYNDILPYNILVQVLPKQESIKNKLKVLRTTDAYVNRSLISSKNKKELLALKS